MRKTVEITGVGRDENKVYRITEFSAFKAEKMAMKVLWAIASSGVEVSGDITNAPLAKLLEIGIQALAKVPYPMIEPILIEMMEGVSFITPDNSNRKLLPDDIEEFRTILKIRKEVVALHIDFFIEN